MTESSYQKIQLRITPLTPLWTGDANKKGRRVLETGILGSLRWWYEALLRGLGVRACDPSRRSCEYDEKKGLEIICSACRLFGCTGYSRSFRLMIEGDGDAGERDIQVKIKTSENREHRGWRIPSRLAGELALSFIPMRPNNFGEFEITSLYYLLRLIESYGALGAKASQGQGVIRVTEWGDLKEKMRYESWKEQLKAQPPEGASQSGYPPDLRNFLGATIVLNDALDARNLWDKLELEATLNRRSWQPATGVKWLPSAPRVRAHLRGWLMDEKNVPHFTGNLRPERHRLMGAFKPPKGSDVFVSHFYMFDNRWRMRIFAFIPRDGNKVDKEMRALLTDPKKLKSELHNVFDDLKIEIILYPKDIKGLLTLTEGDRS